METHANVGNIMITYTLYVWNEFLAQTEKIRENKSSFKIFVKHIQLSLYNDYLVFDNHESLFWEM